MLGARSIGMSGEDVGVLSIGGNHIRCILSGRGKSPRVCAFFLFMDGIVFADCIVVSLWHSFFGMDGGAFHFLAYARCFAPFWTGSNAWDDSCGFHMEVR